MMGLAAPRLSPAEFRTRIKTLGWTYRELATWWGVTDVWVSMIARNHDRSRHWDDAVRGLMRRRDVGPLFPDATKKARGRSKSPPSYRGVLVVGAVVVATKDFGSLATEGERGTVESVNVIDGHEHYRVKFASGKSEIFTADLVDEYLAFTGIAKNT